MYRDRIQSIAGIDYDPRHVEAYMRLAHSTLDGLSAEQFAREVGFAVHSVNFGGPELAELLAQTFDL